MTTRGVVDVVFSLDASDSMRPCIVAVKDHMSSFLEGLHADLQRKWDVRFDYVAHFTGVSAGGGITHHHESLFHYEADNLLLDALYTKDHPKPMRCFTSDIDEFKQGLDRIQVAGDEGPLVALDSCLDFPWRYADDCHRVIIFLTDEAFETSSLPEFEIERMDQLQQKVEDLRVLLFIVAPESAGFDRLSEIDRCEYEVVDGLSDGLTGVNFDELLAGIGKSVSVSVPNQRSTVKTVTRGLFDQENWGVAESESLEDRT